MLVTKSWICINASKSEQCWSRQLLLSLHLAVSTPFSSSPHLLISSPLPSILLISSYPRFLKFSDSEDIISDISSDWSVFACKPAPHHRQANQMLSPSPRGILKRPTRAQQGNVIIRRVRSAEPLDQSPCVAGNRDNNNVRSLERGEQKVTHAPSAVFISYYPLTWPRHQHPLLSSTSGTCFYLLRLFVPAPHASCTQPCDCQTFHFLSHCVPSMLLLCLFPFLKFVFSLLVFIFYFSYIYIRGGHRLFFKFRLISL